MLYREFVARIAKVTRFLVDQGTQGEFDPSSSEFRTSGPLPEEVTPGHLLVIPGGDSSAVYEIKTVHHESGAVIVDRLFNARRRLVSWEIYTPGVSEEDVRKVLLAFPDVIMECEEGEQVRTYLGTFRMTRRKRKRVKDPKGNWTYSEEKLVARVRPGKRLQREITKPSEPSTLPASDPDEDP